MSHSSLPLFSYPSTVMLVGNSNPLIKNLTAHISNQYHVITHLEFKSALANLLNRQSSHDLIENYLALNNHTQTDDEHTSVYIDYTKLTANFYHSNRSKEIAIVIAEHNPPELNAITFFQKIAHLPVKKIMLANSANYQLATEAFNKGIIDQFIVQDISLWNKLPKTLLNTQHDYFVNLSLHIPNCLRGTFCQSSMLQLMKKHHIIAYCQIDNQGSYYAIDKNHNSLWFAISTDETINNYIDIAKEGGLDKKYINQLAQRTHCLFLPSDHEKRQPVFMWPHYLFEITSVHKFNTKNFYCALIKNPEIKSNLAS